MNFKETLNKKGLIMICVSLLILLGLSACSSSASTTSLPIVGKETLPATAAWPTMEPTGDLPEKQDYPYFLPFATKLENVSQTLDGVTVKIDWAYVDESRVAIQYTISGLDWPDGSYMDSSTQIHMSIPELTNFQFGGFGGALGGYASPSERGVITGTSDQGLSTGIWDADNFPSVNLGVVFPVAGPADAGTFQFEFTVPVVSGSRHVENIDQTIIASNVSMTLKSLILSPSHAEALVCFQMPSAIDWGLTASKLNLRGREYPFSGGGLATEKADLNSALTSPERCNNVGFDIAFDARLDTSVTLTVPYLQASIPEMVTDEMVDRANQRLADEGILFEYKILDHGANIIVLERPDGSTDPEIFPLIWNALAEQYEGPWVFTVEFPK